MKVADSNLIACLHLQGLKADAADAVLLRDSQWWVPLLWRSGFRNTLFACMRTQGMEAATAQAHLDGTLEHLGSTQKEPDPVRVLAKVIDSNLSAYDAGFVVLAE